ncbi:HD domain-containing protein [Catenuloplanes japonicus]|uniref:HD domain-containing protein n=1 Tax=Catenuloplanes japonicus TaxID=33876 RepID=UPI0005257440|nr:HD domain-containing protein [Catenuloplanes japonicus]
MIIPSDEQIRDLHARHAPTAEAFEKVWTHCEIVCAIAEQLMDAPAGPDLDRALVRAGCLLHDIGVYRLYDEHGRLDGRNYVTHGLRGHDLLREEGLPDALCRICSHHTGVGISREDVLAQRLPLPPADYLATTAEERLVMYADKFHSKKTPPVFNSVEAFAASIRRFGADKPARFQALRDEFGTPDLVPLARRYQHALV